MLTPDELAKLPKGTVSHFERLEADLLCDIARRIRTAGTMTNSAEWQMIRLQELGASADYIKRRLRQTLNMSRAEIDRLYLDAADRSSRFDEELLNRLGHSTKETYNKPYVQQTIQAAREQAGAELENLTATTAFHLKDGRTLGVERAFQNALDYTQWQVASGGVDSETAIRNAVRELADSGLRTVNYASGVQRSIEAAVRCCVVTGLSQITAKISESNADLLGTDIVEVTAHPGARPDHAQWQGKWYSLRGETPEYPNLARVTGYGTVTGLKGANCRHDFHPVIPELSAPTYTEKELEELANPPKKVYEGKEYTFYEATQKQRQIERRIRQSKRRLMGYREAGLDEDADNERIRLRRLNELYTDFSRQTGLVEQRERMFTVGVEKPPAKKSIANGQNSAILNEKDVRAIHDYMGSGVAYRLNESLRLVDSGMMDRVPDELEPYQTALDVALSNLPDYDGIVYRSLSSEYLTDGEDAFWMLHTEGEKVSYPAFTSASKEIYDEKMDIQMVIRSKHAKDISKWNENEAEVLFPRNARFIVKKVVVKVLYLEEL